MTWRFYKVASKGLREEGEHAPFCWKNGVRHRRGQRHRTCNGPCVRRGGHARHACRYRGEATGNTVAAFKGNLAEVRGVVCDVRDYADVERAAQAIIDAFGKRMLVQ